MMYMLIPKWQWVLWTQKFLGDCTLSTDGGRWWQVVAGGINFNGVWASRRYASPPPNTRCPSYLYLWGCHRDGHEVADWATNPTIFYNGELTRAIIPRGKRGASWHGGIPPNKQLQIVISSSLLAKIVSRSRGGGR